MTRSNLTTSAAAFCAALSLAGAAAAAPASGADTLTHAVRYTPASLNTTAGAKDFAQRLKNAAYDVCGGEARISHISDSFARCREAAIDRALAGVNAPLVAQALGRAPSTALAER